MHRDGWYKLEVPQHLVVDLGDQSFGRGVADWLDVVDSLLSEVPEDLLLDALRDHFISPFSIRNTLLGNESLGVRVNKFLDGLRFAASDRMHHIRYSGEKPVLIVL